MLLFWFQHFGKEIIAKELNVDQDHPDVLRLFLAVYKSFMEVSFLPFFLLMRYFLFNVSSTFFFDRRLMRWTMGLIGMILISLRDM